MFDRIMPSLRKIVSVQTLLLFALSAAVFLPYAFQLTYYLDDWYYVYSHVVRGPNVFHEMFSVDRPARGYFFDAFFSIFGANPLPYHLGAYGWRLAAGLGAFQLLNIVWEEKRITNFFIALLFMLYPGYSWWVSAIEYQPMAASLALQIFSILLTLQSIRAHEIGQKVFYALGALATGWAYVALVEYAVGAEVLRFLCIYLLMSRDLPNRFPHRFVVTTRTWFLYASSVLAFAVWRVFFFESGRHATNIELFAGGSSAPLKSLTDMGNRFYISVINAGAGAWYKPLLSRAGELSWNLPLRSLVLTLTLGVVLALIGMIWNRRGMFMEESLPRTMPREAITLGFVSLVFGALPVVFFGRFINLSFYSHYGLPASLACVILLAGLIAFLPSTRLQFSLLSLFVLAAALNHSLLAEKTLTLEKSLASFWWQASWRIPGLRPDTTFVTVYPYPNIVDGDLGLPESANLIYFPEPRNERPLRYPVSAIMPTDENIENILTGKHGRTERYRTFETVIRYDNILVLTQPNPSACVRVVDGENFIPSELDSEAIRQISRFSKIENIRLIEGHSPPAYAFGEEPLHGWCYYFEKAGLAIQEADWQSAAQFGDEAFALGLSPSDPVEWYPFIQAYAMTGNTEKLNTILAQTESNTFFTDRLCETMRNGDSEFSPSQEIKGLIEGYSCK